MSVLTHPRLLVLRPYLYVLAGLCSLPASRAAENWDTFLANSPFGASTRAERPAPPTLEFRGYVQEGDVRFFNLYDTNKKTSRWVAVDADSPDLKVIEYDVTKHELIVVQGDKRLTLPLKQSAVALVASPSPEAKPTDTNASAGFTLSNDEKGNLQKIAEEIRRRRAVRAQSESEAPAEKSADRPE